MHSSSHSLAPLSTLKTSTHALAAVSKKRLSLTPFPLTLDHRPSAVVCNGRQSTGLLGYQ